MQKAFLSLLLLTCLLPTHIWTNTTATEVAEPKDYISKGYTYITCALKPIHRTPQRTTVSSSNWSGYVAASNFSQPINDSVTYVAGSWTVPTITASSSFATSSAWVGIDGFANGTVEQIGTEHDWNTVAPHYYAWFEMFPQSQFQLVGFPVEPGDSISASVAYVGNNTFSMTLANNTKRVCTMVPTSATTSAAPLRSCAEWITEATFAGYQPPLATFKTIPFNLCSATIHGTHGAINNPAWQHDMIIMASNNTVEALPSALSADGSSFTVAWKS